VPLGDAVSLHSFWVFLMNGLAVMNTRQAKRAMWLDFDVLGFL